MKPDLERGYDGVGTEIAFHRASHPLNAAIDRRWKKYGVLEDNRMRWLRSGRKARKSWRTNQRRTTYLLSHSQPQRGVYRLISPY
jgi:hypothetical protein